MPQNTPNLRMNQAQARVRERMQAVDQAAGTQVSKARQLMQQMQRQHAAQTTDVLNNGG